VASASTSGASASSDLDQKMHQIDNQLDSIFADTFRSFGGWFGASALASSIDLQEQKNSYVVRVYVPEFEISKVNARVENNALHVTAEAAQKENGASQSERYEQIISLPGPVESNKMQIDRKKNLVVITLPKAANTIAATSPSASSSFSLEKFD
jgi:HSP20 family molecular chaperone IbpA